MILYQIFDQNSCTWLQDCRFHGWIWCKREEATLYSHSPDDMIKIIKSEIERGTERGIQIRQPVIRPYDIWAARQVLLDLSTVWRLGDIVSDVRKRENQWSGPLLTTLNDTIKRAREIMQ